MPVLWGLHIFEVELGFLDSLLFLVKIMPRCSVLQLDLIFSALEN